MVDALALWAKYIYGPLTDDRARLIDESGGGAPRRRRRRRGAPRSAPPREFILLDRSAIGLGSVFLHLNAKLNWHRAFEELIEGFESDILSAR